MDGRYFKDAVKIGLLAAVYFATARFGLSLAALHESVSLVWPPTGIALAALLAGGERLWPGIFLGAFFANLFATHAGPAVSFGIAAGNTLEALVGTHLLRRFVQFEPSLERLQDVLGLVFFGALLGTAISASLGVTSLCLRGSAPWNSFGVLWGHWWLGDMIGALVVAPFLLTWSRPPQFSGRAIDVMEMIGLGISILIVGKISFISIHPHLYPIFPVLVWAALRFGPRGATLATLTVSTMAVLAAVSEPEPFANMKPEVALSFLQPFMAVVALTTMVLAAITTERKKAEEKLKQANEELLHLSEVKSEFASMVSHELRTPLSSIKEGIEIVLDGTEGPVTEGQKECLGIAKSNVDRLARLINNVLDYSKLESGKMDVFFESTNMNALVTEIFELMKRVIKNKKIEFLTEIPQRTVIAVCDPDKIKQVLINLIDNAVKYTDENGKIVLRLSHPEGLIRLEVEDTGIGIKPEDREKIFEMFGQALSSDSRGKAKKRGSGVGLAVCKLIIDQHKGAITVRSDPGKGSLFSVFFPDALIGTKRKA